MRTIFLAVPRMALATPCCMAAGVLLACLQGCAVASVAGSVAGASISVAGAVVSTGVTVAGKVASKTIDLALPDGDTAQH